MKNVVLLIAVFVLSAVVAQAQQVCTNCQPSTATAQGVAELCARHRILRHWGGNRGLEGVGSGSTPDQALRNCCYSNSGRQVVDQGVAFGGGRWFACKRYR